jgi:hypothetical protein
MQLRTTPAEKEFKEKVNRKRKRKLRLEIVSKSPWLHNYNNKEHDHKTGYDH